MSLKSLLKGWVGEVQGVLAHKLLLDSRTYLSLNNVTLPTRDGTTQIDHILVSRYGIFVIETKNMDGWIFGSEHDAQWTQCLYGKKYRFQNPLRQNYRHTRALSEFLGIEHTRFFSVVMFWGNCEFKTSLPPNVLNRGYTTYIQSKTDALFSDEEAQQIAEAIRTGRLPPGWKTQFRHIASLRDRRAGISRKP